MALANKYMKPGVIGELEFDSMTAVTGAGLGRTNQVHLTNAGENIGHFGFTPTNNDNRLKRFSCGKSYRTLDPLSSRFFVENLEIGARRAWSQRES